jgi:hypothetical protein
MPVASPTAKRAAFITELGAAVSLSVDSRNFKIDGAEGPKWIGRERAELISGLASIRMHLAWEEFLEETFVRYLCGVPPTGGPGPVLLQPTCSSLTAGRALLMGGKDFLSWQRKMTRRRACRYFDSGYNFTPALIAAADSIDTLVAVRNAAAHRSSSATRIFHQRVRARFGYLPADITPGGFLIRADPKALGRRIVESLELDLRAAANTIAP